MTYQDGTQVQLNDYVIAYFDAIDKVAVVGQIVRLSNVPISVKNSVKSLSRMRVEYILFNQNHGQFLIGEGVRVERNCPLNDEKLFLMKLEGYSILA